MKFEIRQICLPKIFGEISREPSSSTVRLFLIISYEEIIIRVKYSVVRNPIRLR
jgi:hypothetical protein